MPTTQADFLSLVSRIASDFVDEDGFNRIMLSRLPKLLNSTGQAFKPEHTTTQELGKASARADIVVFSEVEPDQAIIIFELKLSRSVNTFESGSYETAERQLNNYAQDCRALYGVLISETECRIYKYKYDRSNTSFSRISILPTMQQIESELAKRSELVIKRVESLDKSVSEKFTTLNEKNQAVNAKLGEVAQNLGEIKKEKNSAVTGVLIGAVIVAATIWGLTKADTSIECPVKGNVNSDGKKTYHLKEDPYYNKIKLKLKEGDACFATEKAAMDAGFSRASQYTPQPAPATAAKPVPKPAPQKIAPMDCPVKGNVNPNGQRYYHLKGSQFYDKVKIVEAEGDHCFNTEQEAIAADFTRPGKSPQAKTNAPLQKMQPTTAATNSGCYIKGNVNSTGKKYYHLPGDSHYNLVKIKPEEGDACFNTSEEAEKAGFIRAGSWVKK